MSLRDISARAEMELLDDLDGAVTPMITPRQSRDPAVTADKDKPANGTVDQDGGGSGKLHMKKQLGLLEGCAIILGIIFGSGERECHRNFLNQ